MLFHAFKRPNLAAFCLAVAVLTVTACGKGGLERVPVSGTVSFGGQPIAKGTIRFAPRKGQQIPMSGAHIKDGKYIADSKGGVVVGEYRIVIEAHRKGKQANPNIPLPPGVDRESIGWVQYIPAKYNNESELTFTVESGAGDITKDFDLPR
ncbi:MAG: hypothetical protein U9N87_08390 [Planctomycetota bacterium]|nr:hypothetical protein [Planctomycetota bacterium]